MGDQVPEVNALLTDVHRRHLQYGYEEELSDSAERMERKRVRDRTEVSVIADGPILNDHVDPTRVFEDSDPADVAAGVQSFVSFLYEAADSTPGVNAETVIKDGVAEGRGDRLARIKTKLRTTPSEVTMGELQLLAEHGYLSDEQHTELFARGLAGGLSGEDIEEIVGEPQTPPSELQHTLVEMTDRDGDDDRPEGDE